MVWKLSLSSSGSSKKSFLLSLNLKSLKKVWLFSSPKMLWLVRGTELKLSFTTFSVSCPPGKEASIGFSIKFAQGLLSSLSRIQFSYSLYFYGFLLAASSAAIFAAKSAASWAFCSSDFSFAFFSSSSFYAASAKASALFYSSTSLFLANISSSIFYSFSIFFFCFSSILCIFYSCSFFLSSSI